MLARVQRLAGNPEKGALLRAVQGSLRRPRVEVLELESHLEATYRWLCAAQDAAGEGGVAGLFDLWGGQWAEAYPETTGYIIPSFLALAEVRADDQARARALRMADWSCAVQMEDGAVLSGLVGMPRGPAVFNTGQAIFGWLSAYEASGTERYAQAARSASEWLVRHQDEDGAWRRNLSVMTTAPVHTFNGRCAWALAYAASVLGEGRYAEAARNASDWVLSQQNGAGWFAHNAFAENEVPLLHTIAYVLEGLLGVYAFTGEQRFLQATRRGIDGIVAVYDSGALAGRLDQEWRATVSWRCPTGDAQLAIVLHRLGRLCPGHGYEQIARRLIDDSAKVQLTLCGAPSQLSNGGPAAGGLPGSYPIWGPYMRFALPNWAAKFFLDALLLELHGVDEKSFPWARLLPMR